MTQMLKLLDKDIKTAIITMLQKVRVNHLEKNNKRRLADQQIQE